MWHYDKVLMKKTPICLWMCLWREDVIMMISFPRFEYQMCPDGRGWGGVMSLVIFTVTFGELMSGSGHPDTNIHDQRPEFLPRLSLDVVVVQLTFAILADTKIQDRDPKAIRRKGTHFQYWTSVILFDIGNSSVLAQTIAKPLTSSNFGQELLQILSNGRVDVFLLPQ